MKAKISVSLIKKTEAIGQAIRGGRHSPERLSGASTTNRGNQLLLFLSNYRRHQEALQDRFTSDHQGASCEGSSRAGSSGDGPGRRPASIQEICTISEAKKQIRNTRWVYRTQIQRLGVDPSETRRRKR